MSTGQVPGGSIDFFNEIGPLITRPIELVGFPKRWTCIYCPAPVRAAPGRIPARCSGWARGSPFARRCCCSRRCRVATAGRTKHSGRWGPCKWRSGSSQVLPRKKKTTKTGKFPCLRVSCLMEASKERNAVRFLSESSRKT